MFGLDPNCRYAARIWRYASTIFLRHEEGNLLAG